MLKSRAGSGNREARGVPSAGMPARGPEQAEELADELTSGLINGLRREYDAAPSKPRGPSKYRNRVTVRDGVRYDSEKEAARGAALALMEKAGVVRNLMRQVTYPLEVNGELVARYVADFVYIEQHPDGRLLPVVEDVKSEITKRLPLYRLKMKLMHACLGITIRET